MAFPKLTSQKALRDRITELRAEIDSLIDELVERDIGYSVPRQVLRDDLTRHSNCQCAIYNMLHAKGTLK
jgi:hypothetical protein